MCKYLKHQARTDVDKVSFCILSPYIYWYLSFLIYEVRHSIKYPGCWGEQDSARRKTPAGIHHYTSTDTRFEWRNKTMKISDELTLLLYSFLLPCLCPDPRAAQLNPSLTNKSILQRLLKKDSKRFQKCKTTHFSFCNKTNTIYPSKAWSIFHNISSQLSILAPHSLQIPEVSRRAV